MNQSDENRFGLLKKNELRPHMNDYWCIPPKESAEFVANMEDILDKSYNTLGESAAYSD